MEQAVPMAVTAVPPTTTVSQKPQVCLYDQEDRRGLHLKHKRLPQRHFSPELVQRMDRRRIGMSRTIKMQVSMQIHLCLSRVAIAIQRSLHSGDETKVVTQFATHVVCISCARYGISRNLTV